MIRRRELLTALGAALGLGLLGSSTHRVAAARGRPALAIGVGGTGGRALATMARSGPLPFELLAVDADAKDLERAAVPRRTRLGPCCARGLGAGADPALGQAAALESRAELARSIEGFGRVFLVAGLGGGTGTGAAPVVARLAREVGARVIAVAYLPFAFEGRRRRDLANAGLAALRPWSQALFPFSNQALLLPAGGLQHLPIAYDPLDQAVGELFTAVATLDRRSA